MEAKKQIESFLTDLNQGRDTLIGATLSSPTLKKTSIRLVQSYYQITKYQGNKAIHQNVDLKNLVLELKTLIPQYRQVMFYTVNGDYHLLISKKGKMTFIKKPATRTLEKSEHNRDKKYLLKDEPFLTELGVTNNQGKVYAKKQDKFYQVNRFVEIVADVAKFLPKTGPIRVVDFGCGKATLTFGLYAYLESQFQGRVFVHGVDQREDIVRECKRIAESLRYDRLTFSVGSIEDYNSLEKISMCVALHACDTATDDALIKAINWKADVILAAPCCQHEVATQVKNKVLRPLLKHGILKERFASLVTDALRAEFLEEVGYNVKVLEFIDFEHTAKNLLIRAVKDRPKKSKEREEFQDMLNINPKLIRFFK